MKTSAVSTELDSYAALCQRRYNRANQKADLMERLANTAAENGEMEVASVLRNGAADKRQAILKAAAIVSGRMSRIATE